MARKPITTSYMGSGPDKSNMIAIQKRFTSEAWDELLNTAFNVSINGTTFNLQLSWQEIKDTYAEVYICVRAIDDKNHTIIIPTTMIGKVDSSAIYNLAPSVGASMFITLGGLTDKTGTIRSNVNTGSTRLIILAR